MPFFLPLLRRAFASNPRAIAVSPGEARKLDAAGIRNPILRSYLVWRRSLMIFALVATVLSTTLSTYRELTEGDERPDLIQTITRAVPEGTDLSVPQNGTEFEEQDDAAEIETEEPATVDAAEDAEPQTSFGQFADLVQLTAMYALQAAALAVVVFWKRFQLAFRIMTAAFVFSFMAPLVIALCPWSWWGYVETTYSPQDQPFEYLRSTAEGLLEGASYLVTLLPTVLSLIPAVQRACVRIKMLLPAAMLPGWFLVVASPFYALFLLVVFVAVNQVGSSLLFMAGMLLFLSAPLMYTVRSSSFTRPLTSDSDYASIRNVQRVVGGLTVAAGGLLLTFLGTQDVMGVRLLGLDPNAALIVPLDLIGFVLEFVSRSMFVTALGADLFLRMNLAAWQNTRDFYGTPEAANYDAVMGELERLR